MVLYVLLSKSKFDFPSACSIAGCDFAPFLVFATPFGFNFTVCFRFARAELEPIPFVSSPRDGFPGLQAAHQVVGQQEVGRVRFVLAAVLVK